MAGPLIPNPRFLLHSLVRDKKLFTLTIIYTVNEFKKMASSKNRKVKKKIKLPDYFSSRAVGKKMSTSCVSFLTRELKADVTRDD